MKKNKLLFAGVALASIVCSTSCNVNLKGAYAFMFKSTGIVYGNTLYSGFEKTMKQTNYKYVNKSPSDATVGDQIQMIETLTLQGVQSLTISANSTAGYDEVLKRATDKGMKIVSVDAAVSPKYRTTHCDHCNPDDVGKFLAQAAILMGCEKNYPGKDGKQADADELENLVGECIKTLKASKKKLRLGVISSTVDAPNQNGWIKAIRKEFDRTNVGESEDQSYADVISDSKETGYFEIKYGNDENVASTECANAFIQDRIDVIIAISTVPVQAAGTLLKEMKKKDPSIPTKLTGLGMPSEDKGFMPLHTIGDEKKLFDEYVCPYMMLWRVDLFGEIAAQVSLQAVNGKYDSEGHQTSEKYTGQVDEKINIYRSDKNEWKEYTTVWDDESDHSKGTKLVCLEPFVFYDGNMAEWKDKL